MALDPETIGTEGMYPWPPGLVFLVVMALDGKLSGGAIVVKKPCGCYSG